MDADLVNNLSLLGFGRRAYMSLISRGGRSFLLNHERDTELVFSRLDMLKVRWPDLELLPLRDTYPVAAVGFLGRRLSG